MLLVTAEMGSNHPSMESQPIEVAVEEAHQDHLAVLVALVVEATDVQDQPVTVYRVRQTLAVVAEAP